MQRHSWDLTDDWRLREHDAPDGDTSGWLPATVPGVVQQDLIRHGVIPDPNLGTHETAIQWVGEHAWEYETRFTVPADADGADRLDLCLDGLDTFVEVWLDGELVHTGSNMFLPARVDVSGVDRAKDHTLRMVFGSALAEGHRRQTTHGFYRHAHADDGRVHIRKTQCHWGWDWGPTVMTAGPWQPVRLEAYRRRLADVHIVARPGAQPATEPATVHVTAHTAGADVQGETLLVELLDPDGATVEVAVSDGAATAELTVPRPRLWWPRGYGDQPLYTVRVTAVDANSTVLDVAERRVGIRTVELVQEPIEGEEGTGFRFDVNGERVFCGGVNWIPADQLLPTVTPERYRAWLELTAAANSTMIRVWGGGIYEHDAFYDACDELGLLVWQDFMFACGMYPAYDEFADSVRREAEHHVKRLRHHASLALWCGNNEDYQVAEGYGVYAGPDSPITEEFPARRIYEQLLPDVCGELDPGRPYWPGSPYLGGSGTFDATVGDQHHWMPLPEGPAPFKEFWRGQGRFVSEFGIMAMPDEATIDAFTPDDERVLGSPTLLHHDKSIVSGPDRTNLYVAGSVGVPDELSGYVYATQLTQAEALGGAVAAWRRLFRGPGADGCSGALVWQINDCWPALSWSIVDYYLRPKGGYWALQRELAPYAVGLEDLGERTAVWAVNGTTEAHDAELVVTRWLLAGQPGTSRRERVSLQPNRAVELGTVDLVADRDHAIGAELLVDGHVVAYRLLLAAPFSAVRLTEPDLSLRLTGDGDGVELATDVPAKGVVLSAPGVSWSQNMLDLLPGRPVTIDAPELRAGAKVTARWLGAGGKPALAELAVR